ncbi:hypothetical protein NKL05_13975 [Mesorhizobium sp. C420B]|uniref:hypothetical protein n=1 Tax=unclassified Mesorhizobium TaxID=325217 RepID=UPI0012EB755F|nr:hypothetical protein [Mesorhizobium sp. LSHC420B00]
MQEVFAATPAAIVIFAYNRVDRLQRLIQSLEECREFRTSPVRIYVDGPRNLRDAVKVNEVINFLSKLKHKNVKIVSKEKNNGLRNSIHSGVGEVLREYDRAIILEDDLVVSPDILAYFNAALNKYDSDSDVYSVCAYTPLAKGISSHTCSLVLPSTHPWGWATWRRAWLGFDLDLAVRPEDISSRAFRNAFNLSGYRDYATMLRLTVQGRLDSWFLMWNYFVFTKRGVSIFPPRPLVANAGFSEGTHSSRWNMLRYLYKQIPPARFDFELATDIRVDYWAIDCLARSREAWLGVITTKAGTLKRMVRDRRL